MKEVLDGLVSKVNDRFSKDEKYREKLKDVKKSINIEFDGKDNYHFYVNNANLSPVEEGKIDADINIMVGSDVFNQILSKQMDALSAYVSKKIKIKASLMDKILISELLK
ncbi:MAG: SCP2 sterol-binding domain-containing protein [Thermoplasmata archaeon]